MEDGGKQEEERQRKREGAARERGGTSEDGEPRLYRHNQDISRKGKKRGVSLLVGVAARRACLFMCILKQNGHSRLSKLSHTSGICDKDAQRSKTKAHTGHRRRTPLSLCPPPRQKFKKQRAETPACDQQRSAATSRYGSFAPRLSRLSRPSRQLVTRAAPPLRRALASAP